MALDATSLARESFAPPLHPPDQGRFAPWTPDLEGVCPLGTQTRARCPWTLPGGFHPLDLDTRALPP